MARFAPLAATAAAWATPLLAEAAALARNVVLARLLGPEELGKLMMLALTLRLVEMVSDLSLERLMAQADDGGALAFQRQLHGFAIVRGLVLGAAVVVLALPVAVLAGDGIAPMAVAALAAGPVLRGFVHLDHRRLERGFDYRASLLVEGGAALVMLAVAPLAALAMGDHRALLPVVVAQGLALVVLSRLVARRRYRVAFSAAAARRLVAFGWPLLLNGALLFLIVQGDRLIAAAFYDWETVGRFAVLAQLAMLPALVTGRAAAALLLPAFRRARASGTLSEAARPACLAYGALAAAFLPAFALLAPPAVALVYGEAFAPEPALALALGAAAAIRIARTPLSQLAVAMGRTSLPARANLPRALSLGLAAALAAAGAPIAAVAAAGALGEALAALAAVRLSVRALAPPAAPAQLSGATP